MSADMSVVLSVSVSALPTTDKRPPTDVCQTRTGASPGQTRREETEDRRSLCPALSPDADRPRTSAPRPDRSARDPDFVDGPRAEDRLVGQRTDSQNPDPPFSVPT